MHIVVDVATSRIALFIYNGPPAWWRCRQAPRSRRWRHLPNERSPRACWEGWSLSLCLVSNVHGGAVISRRRRVPSRLHTDVLSNKTTTSHLVSAIIHNNILLTSPGECHYSQLYPTDLTWWVPLFTTISYWPHLVVPLFTTISYWPQHTASSRRSWLTCNQTSR